MSMTLIEELEQAARDYRSQSRAMARTGMINEARDATRFADRIDARIAHIRELEAIAEAMTHNRVRLEAIRDVTGPIPSTEEPKR